MLPQNPYIEQQFPFGQFPQAVPPLEAPQVPSAVACVVETDPGATVEDTGAIMGSALVVRTPSVQPS